MTKSKKVKIKSSCLLKRVFKTFAKLEDGNLVEYTINGSYEDEFGDTKHPTEHDWNMVVKNIERVHNKKVVGSLIKIWEKKIESFEYEKGPNIKIYETIYTDLPNEFWLEYKQLKKQYFKKFFHDCDPDKEFRYNEIYNEHFKLNKDKNNG